ncbi:MAG: hypothetical protein HY699_06295 [Deltaproteobacteria bacterium]|nr:hypothetical protein [Deltaproteobacteria bacterium]
MVQRIAVFAALRWECQPVLKHLRRVSRGRLGTFPTWRAGTAERELWVIKTGIGIERAAAAAQATAAAAAFDLFLSTGCAGALSPALRPGDVVIATSVIGDRGQFAADGEAGAAARQAAERAALRPILAPVLCSPYALATVAAKQAAAHSGAVAVEMEGAAIAAAAAAAGIAFVSVRAILDAADSDVDSAAAFIAPDTGAVRPLALAAYLTRHPSALVRLLAMQRMMQAAQRSLDRFFASFFAAS